MRNVFVKKIHIGKVRHLENEDIVLSETERKHLILTGKNGSGKTSLLEAMREKILWNQHKNYLLLKEEDREFIAIDQSSLDELKNNSEKATRIGTSVRRLGSNWNVNVTLSATFVRISLTSVSMKNIEGRNQSGTNAMQILHGHFVPVGAWGLL